MARTLLTWELGAGTGHLQNLGAIGEVLRARGHEVLLAAREPATAASVFGADGVRFVQAPYWSGSVRGLPPAANFGELLLRVGYGDPSVLRGLVSAWLELFRLFRPDRILAEHAPTALLAARIAAIPAAHMGSGFMIPPPSSPMPTLQPWADVPGERLANAERAVIATVDEAIAPLGGIGPASVAELMDTSAGYLTTYPELDHYGARGACVRYWGTLQVRRPRPPPRWPAGDGPKLFGYMNAGLDHFDGVLDALRELGHPTLVVAQGLHPDRVSRYAGAHLHVQVTPVDLTAVAREAAVTFGHGGHGTVAALLRHGLPMLVLPQFLEHAVLAWQLSRNTLAFVPNDGPSPRPDLAGAIEQMLTRSDLVANARAFAARYDGVDRDVQVEAIADDVESRVPHGR